MIWQHYHDGVPGHNLLARKDLPFISNWWGAVVLPVFALFMLYRINKRIPAGNNFVETKVLKPIFRAFIFSLIYALLIVGFYSAGISILSRSLFLLIFLIALFAPIYRAEYYLGFVLGLSFAFGGVLPVIIGFVLVTAGFVLHKFVRRLILKIAELIGVTRLIRK
ncbi:MAG: hypothetical protein ACK5Z2_19060 [Bacteroidota bacterium]